jgi:hypothetical protein
MADITMQDMQAAFTAALQQNNSIAANAYAKAVAGNTKAGSSGGGGKTTWKDPNAKGFEAAKDKLTDSIKGVHSGFFDLATNVRSSSKSVSEFSKGISFSKAGVTKFGEGLLTASTLAGAAAVEFITKSMESYRELANYGQTFGGSILNMQLAAAQARLPLTEFAAVITKYNTTVAAVGQQQFFQMGKQLRDNLMQYGELSMSVSELNDVVGGYTQTMAMFGKLQTMSQKDATSGMKDLAVEASALAIISGKNRMELMKDTQQALDDASLRAEAASIQGEAGDKFAQQAQKSVMFMASMPGEAGKVLSKMAAQTLGAGTSVFSEGGKMFINAGLGQISTAMDTLQRKEKAGTASDADRAKFYAQLKSINDDSAQMQALNIQAINGNADAAEAIKVITDAASNSQNYTEDAIRKARLAAVTQDKVTKAMNGLQNAFYDFTGNIKEKILNGILAYVNDPNLRKSFEGLSDRLKALMGGAEKLAGGFFSPQNIDKLAHFAVNLTEGVVPVFEFLVKAIGKVVDGFNALADKIGSVKALLVTILAVWAAKKGAAAIKDELNNSKNRVNAGTIATAVSEGFSETLARYAEGNALRTIGPGGGGGGLGNAAEEIAEEEMHGTGGQLPRGVRWRRAGQSLGRRVGGFGRGIRNLPKSAMGFARRMPSMALRGAGAGLKGLGRLAKGAGGAAGLIGGLGSVALDMAPNFKGKETLSSALSMGGMGAQIGMMFGPLGALVGGGIGAAIGAITANWDTIKDSLGKAIDSITGVFKTVVGWLENLWKMSPLGQVVDVLYTMATKGFGAGIDLIKSKFDSAIGTVTGVFKFVSGWLSDKLSWFMNLDLFGLIKKYLPESMVNFFDELSGKKPTSSTGAPSDKAANGPPDVRIDQMQGTITTLQKQLAAQQADNKELHKKLDQLIATVAQGNHQNAALNSAQLNEQKKNNNILGNPITGVV